MAHPCCCVDAAEQLRAKVMIMGGDNPATIQLNLLI